MRLLFCQLFPRILLSLRVDILLLVVRVGLTADISESEDGWRFLFLRNENPPATSTIPREELQSL